jgi:hypothetical protein
MRLKELIKVAKGIRADLNEIANILGEQKHRTSSLNEAFSDLILTMTTGNVIQRFLIINKVYYDSLSKSKDPDADSILKKVKEILITGDDSALAILIEIQKNGYEKTPLNIENVSKIIGSFNKFIKIQNQLCDIWKVDAKITKSDAAVIDSIKKINWKKND